MASISFAFSCHCPSTRLCILNPGCWLLSQQLKMLTEMRPSKDRFFQIETHPFQELSLFPTLEILFLSTTILLGIYHTPGNMLQPSYALLSNMRVEEGLEATLSSLQPACIACRSQIQHFPQALITGSSQEGPSMPLLFAFSVCVGDNICIHLKKIHSHTKAFSQS